jgi:endonuclease/exonuclease/phosphatase (EEP) superfamily protein YafD
MHFFFKSIQKEPCDTSSEKITALSANVFQENKEHEKFRALIAKYNPAIFLTMESDENWEKALSVLDNDYKHSVKVALNNNYSMHLYSKF